LNLTTTTNDTNNADDEKRWFLIGVLSVGQDCHQMLQGNEEPAAQVPSKNVFSYQKKNIYIFSCDRFIQAFSHIEHKFPDGWTLSIWAKNYTNHPNKRNAKKWSIKMGIKKFGIGRKKKKKKNAHAMMIDDDDD
jgi:hypothetical protein